jgi:hypothetical protein
MAIGVVGCERKSVETAQVVPDRFSDYIGTHVGIGPTQPSESHTQALPGSPRYHRDVSIRSASSTTFEYCGDLNVPPPSHHLHNGVHSTRNTTSPTTDFGRRFMAPDFTIALTFFVDRIKRFKHRGKTRIRTVGGNAVRNLMHSK